MIKKDAPERLKIRAATTLSGKLYVVLEGDENLYEVPLYKSMLPALLATKPRSL